MFVKYIQQETGTRVQIKGLGSGFVDQETQQEHNEPMYIHVTYVATSSTLNVISHLAAGQMKVRSHVPRYSPKTSSKLSVQNTRK